ncbi:MAG: calcium-translocating P-type ATPase, PMCA-type [Firmicutes bacterium]|nr:calcium-translocating P-type ATPase, PMCA-type [Bacillota bacterium]
MQWHSLSAPEVLRRQGVRAEKGLSPEEAQRRLSQYGDNRLTPPGHKGIIRKFLEQFSDFMVIILLIAAGISFAVSRMEENGDFVDPIIILLIVILNAVIGVVQESKAEHAIEALQKLSAPESRVRRGGKILRIPSEKIVPGDILLLESGDLIPADARLISAVGLKIEESALTGESFPVEKEAQRVFPEKEPVAEQKNMVFASGAVSAGRGTAVVVETGMQTQMGKIASLLIHEETPPTPLQQRLAKTGKLLGIAAVVICMLIFVMGLLQKAAPLDMFMISVSLAVAAIPEGLPAVVTIVLALGVRRMAQNRAIIRRLPAVETLGSATVICSDKTGTLTQNRMAVQELSAVDTSVSFQSTPGQQLLSMAMLCNNAELNQTAEGWQADGDPTEAALAIAAAQQGIQPEDLRKRYPRVAEFPFDAVRKRMTTVHRLSPGEFRIIVKGAPELLLSCCDSYCTENGTAVLNDRAKELALQRNLELSGRALRVIGVAYKNTAAMPSTEGTAEAHLVFVGFCGLIDPPRPEARAAVSTCRSAGIRPVMITGDHAVTAAAIAARLGILQRNNTVISGSELDNMTQRELENKVRSCSVFARVSPEHKVRIVRALQQNGNVVAMTGDGVNDAPALKAADIGCAMGKTGTDVAKNASDMILTDDNFATIVSAVSEGRGIYSNIRKAVHFLLSCNIGEIMTVFAAFLMRLPSPLLAIQLLWVNLVTDSLPALALGVEPKDRDVMNRRPLPAGQSLFAGGLWKRILLEGGLIGSLSLLAFVLGRTFYDTAGAAPAVGRTMTFAVLSISQLVHAFSMRSEESLFTIGVFSNRKMVAAFFVCMLMQVTVITIPPLAAIFKTVPLSAFQWLLVSLLSSVPLAAVELEKALMHRRQQKKRRR